MQQWHSDLCSQYLSSTLANLISSHHPTEYAYGGGEWVNKWDWVTSHRIIICQCVVLTLMWIIESRHQGHMAIIDYIPTSIHTGDQYCSARHLVSLLILLLFCRSPFAHCSLSHQNVVNRQCWPTTSLHLHIFTMDNNTVQHLPHLYFPLLSSFIGHRSTHQNVNTESDCLDLCSLPIS